MSSWKAVPPPRRSAWAEDREFSFYVLLILTGLAVFLAYIIFRPFLTAMFTVVVMGIGFFPIHKRLVQKFHSVSLAALAVTVFAVLLIFAPFILASIEISREATVTYSSFLQTIRDPSLWPHRLDPLIQEVADQTGIPPERVKAQITDVARNVGSYLLSVAALTTRGFIQQVWTIFLASLLLFPLLRSSEQFRSGAFSMLPLSQQRLRELGVAINQGIIADIYGMVAVGLAEGVLIGLGFWLVGLRSPLLWGAIAAILSCLPFVGVSLVWIPACVVLVLRGNLTNGIVLFLWCMTVVSVAEGYVRSTVVSGRARVNSMLITLSIMGGVVTFGPIGLFAGPVVLVFLATLLGILREEHAGIRQPGSRIA